jgi:hypothetical protein
LWVWGSDTYRYHGRITIDVQQKLLGKILASDWQKTAKMAVAGIATCQFRYNFDGTS